MVKITNPTLNIMVAGDPNTGKANFIKRFLDYYPPAADVSRKFETIYFMNNLDKHFKIQLHDVRNVEAIKHNYIDMDVIFFCYAANDPKSFQGLEKWLRLMKTGEKEIYSVLVADLSNLDGELDNALSEQAKELRKRFKIRWIIESCFVDESAPSDEFDYYLTQYLEVTQPQVVHAIDDTRIEKILKKSRHIASDNFDLAALSEFLKYCSLCK